MDYKTSGVNVEAGRAFINRIRASVQSTRRPEVMGGLGGFGGLFRVPTGFNSPVLVAGTDGVGTKLELAQQQNAHFGVGIDLVAMCVNDVITSGAEPIFFLDYIATGSLAPEAMAEVVAGISQGCRLSNCSLLGGETAEMPGFYPSGRYDLAGFCVGVVEEKRLISGSQVKAGDQIVGVESSGVHSNGFSLIRKVLALSDINPEQCFGQDNQSLMEALLMPTILYSELVKTVVTREIPIHGMAHITGGGLPENLPRCVPEGLKPVVDTSSWKRPELFQWLQEAGQIPENDLWNTFNLGVGFCFVLPATSVEELLSTCEETGLKAWLIGDIQASISSDSDFLVGLKG